MGVFSDLDILQAIKDDRIVLFPFRRDRIKGASIDVTLGEWFYLTDKTGNDPYFNPYSETEVYKYFGEPKRAVRHDEWCALYDKRPFKNIPASALVIVLRPHERILAHTHEFIGIKLPRGTTQMQARSTIGRIGVVVCKDAGWGDPGYWYRWTMEIQNDNDHYVPLVAGSRVAQVVIAETGMVERGYSGSKYQKAQTLEEAIRDWKPSDMLPQLYRDELDPLPDASLDALTAYYEQLEALRQEG